MIFRHVKPDYYERPEAEPIIDHIRKKEGIQNLHQYNCFKVVRMYGKSASSVFKDKYAGNPFIDTNYKIRKPTWPNIGKFFCFKDLEHAVLFMVNYDDKERAYGLFACASDILEPISVCMEDGLDVRSNVRYFWDNIYKSGIGSINLSFNLTTPVKGTYVTDGINLRKLLWKTSYRKDLL